MGTARGSTFPGPADPAKRTSIPVRAVHDGARAPNTWATLRGDKTTPSPAPQQLRDFGDEGL
jgi:hypothetical protein